MPILRAERRAIRNERGSNREKRRYERAKGPFGGRHLGPTKTHVFVYDLNLGGGFVNFTDGQPQGPTLVLQINLPYEGPITVNAEAVYRQEAGVAVRFVDVDTDTAVRLARTVHRSRTGREH